MTILRKSTARRLALALVTGAALLPAGAALAQTPMLGETRAFGFNFCPRGWAATDGQILPISQNQALYSLLGTNFGGDGRTTFGLPDYRGRSPVGISYNSAPNYNLGQKGGAESATMTVGHMPTHNHAVNTVSATGDRGRPNSDFLASTTANIYSTATPTAVMDPAMIGSAGGGQPFATMPPFVTINWCIATQGLFPSRN